MSGHARSQELLQRARRSIAGGVTSSVRTSARPCPLYFTHGDGTRLWDVDGNEYLDFILSYGPSILGHAPPEVAEAVAAQARRGFTFGAQHELEVEAAEMLVSTVPNAEQALFASTGSEAVAAALRVARARTGRPLVLKFQGHYHGWFDGMFASAANALTVDDLVQDHALPQTLGTAPGAALDVATCRWNDPNALAQAFDRFGPRIAAVIVEPVNVNGGVIAPVPGFLQLVRDTCDANGSLLIFDEVITGFRIALGGAQELYGVAADLAVFAKALAGGYPVSAVTGTADALDVVASGKLIHNGTFNGNPLGSVSIIATLGALRADAPTTYGRLHELGDRLAAGLAALDPALAVRHVGPICFSAMGEPAGVTCIQDRRTSDATRQVAFAEGLIERGIHTQGLWYLSTRHTEADVDLALQAAAATVEALG